MIKEIITGASYVPKSVGLLKLPGVKRYVIIPASINIFLFAAVIWYGSDKFDALLEQYLPTWLDWLEFLIWPIFFIASLLIVFLPSLSSLIFWPLLLMAYYRKK